ncbi:sulfite exporter TauE/SafE family protein [Sulfurospirillum sp. 1612]|uniref:sulfite exporter TauE/SafE family protein n=1 Tax=Sulfurospirillum sp. 1612 TaxID=3094835 RepID=UPI002F91E4A7
MMYEYLLYFGVTLFFSTFFAMGGVGSAVALVSVFPMLGQSFELSRALALFVNTSSTLSASVMNFYRGVLDFKFVLPLVLSILIFTPIGAYFSQYVDHKILMWMLIVFLLVSATLMLFYKKEAKAQYTKRWILYLLGAVVGTISGMLGVGGGALLMSLLILLGFDAKKAAYGVSFIIPFSSFGAFVTYLQFVKMDWILLADVTVAALIGGYLGEKIMHFKLSQSQIKKLIGLVLYLIATKMILKLVTS